MCHSVLRNLPWAHPCHGVRVSCEPELVRSGSSLEHQEVREQVGWIQVGGQQGARGEG